jgi:hypothetical protein
MNEDLLQKIKELPGFQDRKAKKMFPNQVACARDYSMFIPTSQPKKLVLIQTIANSLQKEKGHFLFEEIYKVLEESYSSKSVDSENLLEFLENWVDTSPNVENLGKEGDFHAFKLKLDSALTPQITKTPK